MTTGPQLASSIEALRLTLHVLAAAVWVGGQLTVAGLLPAVRRLGPDAPRAVARAFGRLQWPAFGVLVITGIWNITADHVADATTAWDVTLGVKIGVVALAGAAAFLHQRSSSKLGLALFGGVAGVSSVAALVLGVVLAG
ncbi:MAG: hypothetical protein ACRDZ5_03470 [Acidimicrobiales bacterium]